MSKCPCQDAQQKAVVPSDVVASTLTLQLRTRYVTISKCPFLAALNAWQRDLECGDLVTYTQRIRDEIYIRAMTVFVGRSAVSYLTSEGASVP